MAVALPASAAKPADRRRDGRWYVRRVLQAAMADAVQEHVALLERPRLVDLGCGTMPYREMFEPHVERYVGVDVAGQPGAHAAFDADGRAPLTDGFADVVLSTQVLEHVPRPQAYLAEARRLLRPGGLLLLSTHGVWRYHPHPMDLWRWTSEGLREEVERAGFVLTTFRGVLGRGAIGAQMLQDAIVPRLARPARNTAAALCQWGVRLADRLTSEQERATDAGVYLVVATRERSGA